jgi:hypothetical protein
MKMVTVLWTCMLFNRIKDVDGDNIAKIFGFSEEGDDRDDEFLGLTMKMMKITFFDKF